MSKYDLVYAYPKNPMKTSFFSHPWIDYILPWNAYTGFVKTAVKVLKENHLEHYILPQEMLGHFLHVDLLITYVIKSLKSEFPLSLDLPGEKYYFGLGIMPEVPKSLVETCRKAVSYLTQVCYEMGGKRYLYGIHDLSREQVEKQFGRRTINHWQKLKDELDPKHLLNIGVIEHLDT